MPHFSGSRRGNYFSPMYEPTTIPYLTAYHAGPPLTTRKFFQSNWERCRWWEHRTCRNTVFVPDELAFAPRCPHLSPTLSKKKKMVGVGIFFDITSFFCQAADLYLVLAPPDQGTTILPQGIIGIEISHLSVLFFILLPTAAFQNLLNLHRQTEKQNVRAARGFRIFSGLLRTF